MKMVDTKLPDVKILEPDVFGDHRGWFMETWSQKKLAELGVNLTFVQDNQSFTAKRGTLRGIHFQNGEWSQAKLVRVVAGAVIDVAVDLRKGSPTYLQWVGVELSAENKRQLLIPRGFGHGFVTLTGVPSYCTEATLDAETIGLASGGYLDNIGTGAFSKAKNLQKVVIPNGLSAIYSNAFAGVESDSVTLVFEGAEFVPKR